MIANNAHELANDKGMPFIETAEQLRSHDYQEMNKFLFGFLDNISEL